MSKPIRPIRIEGNIAYVPLTQGREAVIDVADIHLVSSWNWFLSGNGGGYASRKNRTPSGSRTTLYMHRVIFGDTAASIDHADCDRLNNRRENLRAASVSQNGYNCGVRPNNKSGLKGVSWNIASKKWMARIQVDHSKHYLGLFSTPKEAHAAYCRAAHEMHGEFARTS